MDEAALLAHIYASAQHRAGDRGGAVTVGPGDDCAAIDINGPRQALLTTDQLIEGRHFTTGTPHRLIAHKAVARSVSDIAACAGEPICALVTAALPEGYTDAHASALFDHVHAAAAALNCPVVGGDIARAEPGAQGVHLSVTALGLAHPTLGPVLRSGARVGDAVFVSGTLGGSFDVRTTDTGEPHHLAFTPRIELAQALADTLGPDLHAMMDVSDGLGVDASRLALASGVALDIDAADVPITPQLQSHTDALHRAVSDGEDYELLFTVAPEATPAAEHAGCTRIGTVVRGEPGVVRLLQVGNEPTRIDALGYVHRSTEDSR